MELTKTNFKQTELGLIPEDWEINELNSISNITRLAGYEYSTVWEETLNGEIIALRGFNIGENQIIQKDFVRISNTLSMRLIRSRLFKGDVIYPCVGTIGNAVVIEEDDRYHIQQNIAKITPNKKVLVSKYLAYYLMSSFGINEIKKFNGSSSQPNILVGSLRKYSIISPPLPEQKAIAQVLSDTDNLIQALEKKLVKKRAIKQGAMQQLLTPKEDWKVRKLGEIANINMGQSPSSLFYNKTGIGLPLIQGNADIKNRKTIIRNYTSQITKRCQKDDIIMSVRAPVGEIALAAFIACIGRGVCAIKYSNKFLYHFLIYIEPQWSKFSTGSTFDSVNGDTIRKLEIPFPSEKEQLQIATILSDMDAEIEQLQKKLDKYKFLKQGLMQELLTGKIRLI